MCKGNCRNVVVVVEVAALLSTLLSTLLSLVVLVLLLLLLVLLVVGGRGRVETTHTLASVGTWCKRSKASSYF